MIVNKEEKKKNERRKKKKAKIAEQETVYKCLSCKYPFVHMKLELVAF